MPNFIALLFTALLLATSGSVLACSIFPNEPAYVLESSESVVLAEPLEISPSPEEIGGYKGNFSYLQTVTWRIVKVWKGSFASGETVSTTARISTSEPCSGWDAVLDYQPKILHSAAHHSFRLYYAATVDWAAPQLDALRKEHDKFGERP